MAVYVDPMQTVLMNANWKWPKACHMFADTEKELVAMAVRIGLKAEWIQRNPRLLHFDLTEGRRKEAVKNGVVQVTPAQLVEFMHNGKIKFPEVKKRPPRRQGKVHAHSNKRCIHWS